MTTEEQLQEHDFGEFKWELLVQSGEDITPVVHAWWTANAWFPLRWPSERLALAERALSELLADGYITLCRQEDEAQPSELPRSEEGAILHSHDTWVIGSEGVKVFFKISQNGLRVLERTRNSKRLL